MIVAFADRADCGREVREASGLRCASSGDQAIVVVQPTANLQLRCDFDRLCRRVIDRVGLPFSIS